MQQPTPMTDADALCDLVSRLALPHVTRTMLAWHAVGAHRFSAHVR
jgi:hypothetical protein